MKQSKINSFTMKTDTENFIGEEFFKEKNIRFWDDFFYDYDSQIGCPFSLHDIKKAGLYDALVPKELGLYILFFEGRLVYIGMSTNINYRLKGHLNDDNKPFDYILWFMASPQIEGYSTVADVLRFEQQLIERHSPPLNLQHLFKR